jgi:hypothetical protein
MRRETRADHVHDHVVLCAYACSGVGRASVVNLRTILPVKALARLMWGRARPYGSDLIGTSKLAAGWFTSHDHNRTNPMRTSAYDYSAESSIVSASSGLRALPMTDCSCMTVWKVVPPPSSPSPSPSTLGSPKTLAVSRAPLPLICRRRLYTHTAATPSATAAAMAARTPPATAPADGPELPVWPEGHVACARRHSARVGGAQSAAVFAWYVPSEHAETTSTCGAVCVSRRASNGSEGGAGARPLRHHPQ